MPKRTKQHPTEDDLIDDILALERQEAALLKAAKAAQADLQAWFDFAYSQGYAQEKTQEVLAQLNTAIAAYEDKEGQP